MVLNLEVHHEGVSYREASLVDSENLTNNTAISHKRYDIRLSYTINWA